MREVPLVSLCVVGVPVASAGGEMVTAARAVDVLTIAVTALVVTTPLRGGARDDVTAAAAGGAADATRCESSNRRDGRAGPLTPVAGASPLVSRARY